METVLEIRNVNKSFGSKHVIKNISFSVNKGEVFGFLGPNGAGKTTLIKMILGLLSIGSGEILIGGVSVKEDFENAIAEVGGIIENPEMYNYISGIGNLKIFSRMYKKKITDERINEVVKSVKLERRINDKVKKYSLGMRQRLGVAQAILHSPKLLILDEPTNGLDPIGIKELRDSLRELAQKEGVAVFVSSHLLSEMELMCDRFAIIDEGRLVDIKYIKDLNKQEELKTTYFIDVSDSEGALKLLDGYKAVISEGKLLVNASREEIPALNKLLVNNSIDIFEISAVKKSLEEEFIKITTGSKGQIS